MTPEVYKPTDYEYLSLLTEPKACWVADLLSLNTTVVPFYNPLISHLPHHLSFHLNPLHMYILYYI